MCINYIEQPYIRGVLVAVKKSLYVFKVCRQKTMFSNKKKTILDNKM